MLQKLEFVGTSNDLLRRLNSIESEDEEKVRVVVSINTTFAPDLKTDEYNWLVIYREHDKLDILELEIE